MDRLMHAVMNCLIFLIFFLVHFENHVLGYFKLNSSLVSLIAVLICLAFGWL